MSVDLTAHGLNKIPTVKEFKIFIKQKVKETLKEDCHNLEFKREGKKSLWVGCKGQWTRGCWFYFGDNSVFAKTYAGRSGADGALQEIGISELVKEYGGEIINDDFSASWTFNKETNSWEKLEIEYEQEGGDKNER